MKKVVSLLLVLVMVLGMATMASAAVATNIDKKMVSSLGTRVGTDSVDVGTINPDVSYSLPLTADMFGWTNGYPSATSGTTYAVTESQLRSGKITFKSSVRAGSKVLRDIGLQTSSFENGKSAFAGYASYTGLTYNVGQNSLKTAYLRIRFVKQFKSVSDADFDFTIYPVVDGKRRDEYAFQVTGTLQNITDEVDDLDDYVDSSAGHIIHSNAYIKLIEVDTGEGLSVWTKMFNDKKYWGVTTRESDDADDVIFKKHPDVDVVYKLDTIGLSSTAQYITLNDVGGDYYVYNQDLKFIGMSNEKLPYATKYYLANKKLDTDPIDEPDDEPDDYPEVPPSTGGDSGYPTNINDNPGTGR